MNTPFGGPRKWLPLVLGAALALAAVAASLSTVKASASAAAGPKIYVVAPLVNNTFWQAVKNGAQQAAKDYGVNLVYAAPQTGQEQAMPPLINAAIASGAKGVAIDYSGKFMEQITKKALGRGLAVVLYNNNRFEKQSGGATTDPAVTRLAYVGQDERFSGEVLAKAFGPLIKKKGTVLLVNPFPTAFVLSLRASGVSRGLKAQGFKTTVLPADTGGDEPKNQQIISSYLTAHPSTVAVVGLGGPGGNPAARAVKEKGLKIPVAVFDVDKTTAMLIQQGGMTLALDQQPYLQGYFAVANLALKVKFGFTPVNVDTGTSIVTKKNLAEVLKRINSGRG